MADTTAQTPGAMTMAWLALNTLLESPCPGRVVTRNHTLEHPAFLQRTLAVAGTLAERRTRHAALWFEDAGNLACALLACWRAGVTAILIGDSRTDTCVSLDKSVDLWLVDVALPVAAHRQFLLDSLTSGPTLRAARLDLDCAGVIVCTSGSTGQPKQIHKRWRQLWHETRALQSHWPDLAQNATVIGSVSAQHMYGLPFRVLWPLCAGRPIEGQQHLYPEDIQAASLSCANAVWITSPALLKRLGNALDWSRLAQTVSAIFSSGGPLPEKTSHALVGHGLPLPIEIYGSSETGAVASRHDSQNWLPLPGADIGATDASALWVRSPWTESEARVETHDHIRLAAHGFVLLDRNDRIVKIEEKRIALPAVEQWLARHEYVEEAHAGQTAAGARLTMLVVLAPKGLKYLRDSGRRAVVEALQRHMAQGVDTLGVPRRWRFLIALPANTQGKISRSDFDQAASTRPLLPLVARLPAKSNFQTASPLDERHCRIPLIVPPDLAYFSGHFPEKPVVPGVAQIDWVTSLAHEYLGISLVFAGIENLKFRRMFRPGDTFDAVLRWEPARARLHFEFQVDTQTVTSGRILHAEAAA